MSTFKSFISSLSRSFYSPFSSVSRSSRLRLLLFSQRSLLSLWSSVLV